MNTRVILGIILGVLAAIILVMVMRHCTMMRTTPVEVIETDEVVTPVP